VCRYVPQSRSLGFTLVNRDPVRYGKHLRYRIYGIARARARISRVSCLSVNIKHALSTLERKYQLHSRIYLSDNYP